MSSQNITLTVSLPFELKKRDKWYLSKCPVLDVHSQGETKEKALENLKEAVELFIITCFERGTLDEVLKQCGFTLSKQKRTSKSSNNTINIPIHLLAHRNASVECRA